MGEQIAEQVVTSSGPSGHNVEYVLKLADWVHQVLPHVEDEHLFSIEAEVRARSSTAPPQPGAAPSPSPATGDASNVSNLTKFMGKLVVVLLGHNCDFFDNFIKVLFIFVYCRPLLLNMK